MAGTDWFSVTALGVAGAALAVVASWRDLVLSRRGLGAVAVLAGTVAAVLAGNIWVLAASWLTASVGARWRSGGRRLDDTRRAAVATLGDALAVAVLAAHAVDVGDAALPWADDATGVAAWVAPVLAAAIALRAVAGSGTDPILTVLAAVVAARFADAALPVDGSEVTVVLAVLAPVAGWASGWVPAAVLLALGTWGLQHPSAPDAGNVALAGALVAIAVAGVTGGARAAGVGRVPPATVPWRLPRVPSPPAIIGVPVFLGLVVAGAVLLQVPAADHPEAVVVAAAAVWMIAVTSNGLTDPEAWALPNGRSGRVATPVGVLGALALLAAYVVPGPWAEVAGVADGVVEDVLRDGRGGHAWAVGFAAPVVALMVVVGRRSARARAGT